MTATLGFDVVDAAPTVRLAQEWLSEAWAEVEPMAKAHWSEVAPASQADIQVALDRESYDRLEQQGLLRFFTVRAHGVLLGYLLAVVMEHTNHVQSLQADVTAVYVIPSERGRSGYQLIKYADEQLRAEGVQVVRHRVKVDHDWSPLLTRLGYAPEEVTWSRRLR
jgi:hypothetical protein